MFTKLMCMKTMLMMKNAVASMCEHFAGPVTRAWFYIIWQQGHGNKPRQHTGLIIYRLDPSILNYVM